MEASFAIVNQANLVDHLRRSARLEDGESLSVTILILALNYSVRLCQLERRKKSETP